MQARHTCSVCVRQVGPMRPCSVGRTSLCDSPVGAGEERGLGPGRRLLSPPGLVNNGLSWRMCECLWDSQGKDWDWRSSWAAQSQLLMLMDRQGWCSSPGGGPQSAPSLPCSLQASCWPPALRAVKHRPRKCRAVSHPRQREALFAFWLICGSVCLAAGLWACVCIHACPSVFTCVVAKAMGITLHVPSVPHLGVPLPG